MTKLRGRWLILIMDVAGAIHGQTPFVFRRSAERYGRSMASPIYDVILVGPRGERETLCPHMDPHELLRQVREHGEAPAIFTNRPRRR
jgi:hypothetical protein